jgi:hypothetical protein
VQLVLIAPFGEQKRQARVGACRSLIDLSVRRD